MFNEIIVKNFSNATYAAELDAHRAVIELMSPVCGDRIRVQFEMVNDVVKGVRFQRGAVQPHWLPAIYFVHISTGSV